MERERPMDTIDTGWLVRRIAHVMDAPTSSKTVITNGFDEEKARGYLREVEAHFRDVDASTRRVECQKAGLFIAAE